MSGTEEFLTPDQLIQRYLDGETNAVQEKRFRLLLGEESFREQVAHYATDFAQLHDLARQGLLDITACGCDRRRPVTFRRVAAITAAACVVLAMATSWLLRSPNGPAPKPPLAKGLAPSPVKPSERPPVIARVAGITGRVLSATDSSSPNWLPVKDHAEIRSGDMLRTEGAGSFALLKYKDGTVVTVVGDTEIVGATADSRKHLEVHRGNIVGHVAPQPQGKSMLIHTPNAEAEVMGTELALFAGLAMTELAVQDGHVRLKNLFDGKIIDVRGGHSAIASAKSEFVAVPIPAISGLWEENFEKGLPVEWEIGTWTDAGGSSGSRGAVRAALPESDFGGPTDQYLVAGPREWWHGLFRVEDDTHFNFTYKLDRIGWFNVMLETRSKTGETGYSGIFLYKNTNMWKTGLGQWRTVSIPLAFFRTPPGKAVSQGVGCPKIGDLVFHFYFSSQETDPGLVIDRIWITQGPPEFAEVLDPWE